ASSLVYSGNPVATYYYHTDHLGSNTYLTDSTGKLMEHVEYMPWGDSWWEQSLITSYTISMNLPFLFTGKEEYATGLYYYGGRYYDPFTSMGLSPDPALEKYIDSVGKGGSEKG